MGGLLDEEGRALVDPASQGREAQRHWGFVFAGPGASEGCDGDGLGDGGAELEDEFLALTPDLSDQEWVITVDDVREAAARTCDTAPGPDGLPYALRRGDTSLADAIWYLLRCVGEGCGDARPRSFGASISNMIPKVDVAFEGESAAVRVVNTRPLACGNTDCKIFAQSANHKLSMACAVKLSEQQRGFITGRSMSESVMLCEATMGGVSLISCRPAAVSLTSPLLSLLCGIGGFLRF